MKKHRYPIYIISKGRHESMLTSRSLRRMNIKHTIAIEPQDKDNYLKALENYDLENHVTLMILPFSNHGDGPGRARNYCWEHSIECGFERHWVLDDNIFDFYRFNRNMKIRAETDAIFRASEDFVDRYENLPLAGFNYLGFLVATEKNPPIILNTRIYSCLLIENSCKYRWRGRYNEDTDLSLRVLKDGDCTVQFNAFLQDKVHTQAMKGGNTEEFYHKEIVADKKEWVNYINPLGTINKSQMLVDMHPDVAKMVWKFNRWHHHVDYSPFRNNKLRLKPGVVLPEGVNNYGMKLAVNFRKPNQKIIG